MVVLNFSEAAVAKVSINVVLWVCLFFYSVAF
jgi:hypothetical protein